MDWFKTGGDNRILMEEHTDFTVLTDQTDILLVDALDDVNGI